MKVTTAYALVWVSCAVAVSVGIVVTGSMAPLFALIIPACMSVSSGAQEDEQP